MDMMGNVSEWCFNASVAREEFVTDPYSKFGGKMTKGSSHIDALGWGLGPVVISEGVRLDTIGFRVMCGDDPVWDVVDFKGQ